MNIETDLYNKQNATWPQAGKVVAPTGVGDDQSEIGLVFISVAEYP